MEESRVDPIIKSSLTPLIIRTAKVAKWEKCEYNNVVRWEKCEYNNVVRWGKCENGIYIWDSIYIFQK